MQASYPFDTLEQEARQYWSEHQTFLASIDPQKPKYYCLCMFPYPSGKLHMGHVRNYTIGDVLSRWHKARGYNVLQPMGWDAFGLPAENAAIANQRPAAQWTWDNIAYMKKQLQSLGLGIDWQRELATCQPEYYRWNQWLFLQLWEKGLVYKKKQTVNWDPVDQTVLANEQVIDGRGWRTGAVVEKREIPGYYLAITRYAEELLSALDTLPGWPERVKIMQANWIGKSIGVSFAFPYHIAGQQRLLRVFTTRADTIMGVTYCAVAAEHPLASYAAQHNPQLAEFIAQCKRGSVMEADLATLEKVGMDTGLTVQHPLTGQQIPVWVANYVLMGYGEGAVMAVPAHDERDFAFAKQYQLPIQQSIAVAGQVFDANRWQDWYADKTQGVCIHSGKYDGLAHQAAVEAITADLVRLGLGEPKTQWRLHDWGISRQRYWGCPIPMIHCPACGDVGVPDDQLPVILPEDCIPDGSGNPLTHHPDFMHTTCPKCGGAARRETDTMDTFVDSSWYYARYASTLSNTAMVDAETRYWMPVDQYIGGIEHAILHLLYARFWSKLMRDQGLVPYDEPFTNLLTQGMVLNHIFTQKTDQGATRYIAPSDVDIQYDLNGKITGGVLRGSHTPVTYQGMGTMSKSKLNGIDPQTLIDQYGADTVRFFMMFTAPPEQTLEWSESGVEGAHRFLKRLWNFVYRNRATLTAQTDQQHATTPPSSTEKQFRYDIHYTLQQANYDLQRFQLNTVASAAMKMLNSLEKFESQVSTPWLTEAVSILLRVLSPITPHITHALWRDLGLGEDILLAGWPEPLAEALTQDEVTLVVQINGKLRGNITVAKNTLQADIEQIILQQAFVQKILKQQSPKKIIVVPNKLVNLVVPLS